jgi:hypothetical protein
MPLRPAARFAALVLVLAASAPPAARSEPQAIGGTCLTCPLVDFGPLTPTAAPQFSSDTLVGGTDCAWYSFRVTGGHSYEFSTCFPLAEPTLLAVVDPADCATVLATGIELCPAPSVGSVLRWDAQANGIIHVRVTPPTAASPGGPYTLGYQDLGALCESCPIPGGGLDVSSTSCNCLTGATDLDCPSDFYTIGLLAGETYELTTCPSVCNSASASFDTLLRIHSPACARLVSNDDSCPTPGWLTRSTVTFTATVSGAHRVEVGSPGGGPGSYSLCGRRLSCGLTQLAAEPPAGSTEPTGCSRTQDFALTIGPLAVLPVTYTWSVVPAAGHVAVPSRGTVASNAPGGAAAFRTRLSGLGTHVIRVTARNACGSSTIDLPYELSDRTPPYVVAPPGVSVECPAPPPDSQPRLRDGCDPEVVMTEVRTAGPCPASWSLRRTWVATDDSGNSSAPVRQVVLVGDRTAPVITPSIAQSHCVFPPDHGRACFTFADFTPLASDACPGPLAWYFARVTHDEQPLGSCDPPDFVPDVEIAGDGTSFCIRAERCNDDPLAGPGRLYAVEAVAVDACGNASPITPIATILVPQDSSDTSACRTPEPWN